MNISPRLGIALRWLALLLGAGWAVAMLVSMVLALLNGRLRSDFLWIGLLMGYSLVGIVLSEKHEWLLVPGGLLVRRGRFWSSRWRLELFAAREALLIQALPAHRLVVPDARRRTFSRPASDFEVQAAQQAWLSRHPPPPPSGRPPPHSHASATR